MMRRFLEFWPEFRFASDDTDKSGYLPVELTGKIVIRVNGSEDSLKVSPAYAERIAAGLVETADLVRKGRKREANRP